MISAASKKLRRLITPITSTLRAKWNIKTSFEKRALFSHLASKWSPNIHRLPGLFYGEFRNLGGWRFHLDCSVKTIQIQLCVKHPEVLNFNHIKVWARDDSGQLYQVTDAYVCEMSSLSKAHPDPSACMLGSRGNRVTIHSKRELNPWWKITFDKEITVEFVEFFNRKDIWGKRSKSLVLSAYDDAGNKVYKYGRVLKAQKKEILQEEILLPSKRIIEGLRKLNKHQLAYKFAFLLERHLNELGNKEKSSSEAIKVELLDSLNSAYCSLTAETPDIGYTKDTSALFESEKANIKYIKIIGFRKINRRPPSVTIEIPEISEESIKLCQVTEHQEAKQIIPLQKEFWTLEYEHIFTYEIPQNISVSKFKIWATDRLSSDVLVNRQISVSEDGQTWHTLDSTFKQMRSQLDIIRLHEILIGDKYTPQFIEQLGHFLATYRLRFARSFKPLLREDSDLLDAFIKGVESGGQSAKHLPNVIYTRHGLTIPFGQIDSHFLAERMKSFSDFIEEKFGLKVFPCYGTLLGMYRDKDFLPHDDDIDVAVVVDLPKGVEPKQETLNWVKRLQEVGIDSKPPTPDSLNVHCYFPECDIDLFFMYRPNKQSDHVLTHMDRYVIRKVSILLLEPYGKMSFKNQEFFIPGDVEGFLEKRYGKGWVSPDPTFEM